MLRDTPMAGLVKLRCGIVTECGGRLLAAIYRRRVDQLLAVPHRSKSASSPERSGCPVFLSPEFRPLRSIVQLA